MVANLARAWKCRSQIWLQGEIAQKKPKNSLGGNKTSVLKYMFTDGVIPSVSKAKPPN